MTIYEFNLLSFESQQDYVFAEGTFLANRMEASHGVNLYHLPGGFFVELYYDAQANALVRARAFRSSTLLGNYIPGIELPEL